MIETNLIPLIDNEISADPHITCRSLAADHDVSKDMVFRILTEDLHLKSVNDRYVPHDLTEDMKNNRILYCRELLRAARTRNITQRLVHTDEKQFYCRAMGCPTTRKSWIQPGGDVPTIARRTPMCKKFMVMVALNFEGLVYFKILENGETVDSQCYMTFLEEAFTSFSSYELRRNGKAILWENAVIQHDNARPHVSNVTQTFIRSRNCAMLKQAPYSPDVNLLDRFLFPKLEMERSKINFQDRDALRAFLDERLQNLNERMMKKQFEELKTHCQRIIEKNGDYTI